MEEVVEKYPSHTQLNFYNKPCQSSIKARKASMETSANQTQFHLYNKACHQPSRPQSHLWMHVQFKHNFICIKYQDQRSRYEGMFYQTQFHLCNKAYQVWRPEHQIWSHILCKHNFIICTIKHQISRPELQVHSNVLCKYNTFCRIKRAIYYQGQRKKVLRFVLCKHNPFVKWRMLSSIKARVTDMAACPMQTQFYLKNKACYQVWMPEKQVFKHVRCKHIYICILKYATKHLVQRNSYRSMSY